MLRVSVYIIAFNEVEKIREAIASVLWADEIVVADSYSTDGTPQIAAGLGARVVQIEFKGFGDLRNRAIEACRGDWIFSLDADERCTPEVRDEILAIVDAADAVDVYRVPRRNWFMGRWIRHSGWYPNYRQPQLFRRGAMLYTLEPVHEGYCLLGDKRLGTLRHAIWQFPFRNLGEVVAKLNRYSSLGAAKVAPGRASMARALASASWAFVKHLVFKRGLLDGWAGFVIAFAYFEQTFYRYAKRYEEDAAWSLPAQAPIARRSPTGVDRH
ncbi:MAG: glycosyltransferase family 2 protein [Pseudomonadota bacterium]|nr:glycosyltransferase family 2 protein [Pseudomonadota bacterium]